MPPVTLMINRGWKRLAFGEPAIKHRVLDMGGASVQVVFPVDNTSVINERDIHQLSIYGHNYRVFAHSFLGLGQNEVTHQFLDSTACFINNYEMPTGEPATGDAYACEREISSLTNDVHQVDLAKSPLFNEGQTFTMQEILEKSSSQICQQQWPQLNARFPNDDYLYGYCLFPSYFYALIVDGYGIQPEKNLNYLPDNGDWTKGVILFQHATQ